MGLGTINKLDIGHGRVITTAETGLENAEISARSSTKPGADFVEQLGNGFLGPRTRERKATIRDRINLGEGDQWLNYAPHFLGFRQRGLDCLVLDQGSREISEQGGAMSRLAVKLPTTLTMTHNGYLTFNSLKGRRKG